MKGIKLVNLFGIELRVTLSWFILFIMMTAGLVSQFGLDSPDWSRPTQIGVGIVASVLFFASVILHELAHSLVARAYKMPVQSITLHLFGGVAQMEREPARAREEFLIAVAGPVMSILLGVLFGLIGFFTADFSPLLSKPALYLGLINFILAAFNLIPGFPLDGGRILRATLWAITDNFRRATKIAAVIGQGVAAIFMMIAFYRLMAGSLDGIWLGLIGFYLLGVARTTYQQVELQYMLRGLKVGSLLLEDLPQISGRINVQDFLDHYIIGQRNRHYMVVDDNVIRGVVSLHQMQDIEEKVRQRSLIESVMTPINSLQRIGPETEVMHALELMSRSNTSQLPVVKNNELLGFIGKDALVNYIRNRFEYGL